MIWHKHYYHIISEHLIEPVLVQLAKIKMQGRITGSAGNTSTLLVVVQCGLCGKVKILKRSSP